MPRGNPLPAIDLIIDTNFEPRPLDECLRQMPLLADICKEHHTFPSVEDTCDICRSGWAAYLQQWTEDRDLCTRKDIEDGLNACIDAVTSAIGALIGEQRQLAKAYVNNIYFRLHLVRVLHDQGAMAAKAEMRRHQEKLAKRD